MGATASAVEVAVATSNRHQQPPPQQPSEYQSLLGNIEIPEGENPFLLRKSCPLTGLYRHQSLPTQFIEISLTSC